MGHESKCSKVQHEMLLFTPYKSRTNSEQKERNKWQEQNELKVKMGEESRWVKSQDGLQLFTPPPGKKLN